MKHIEQRLVESVKKHAETAPDRFAVANSPLMVAAWQVPSATPAKPPREKADGRKFWLKERDTVAVETMLLNAGLAGIHSNRSQIVRAAIHLLANLDAERFNTVIMAQRDEDEQQGVHR